MAESSVVPSLPGLAVAAVEWLPSGAESGLIRVRGRWTEERAREPDLPVLALRAGGSEHRFDSLPDARFSREPDTWRGTYLVPAELVAVDPEALWLEWPSGARAGLPALSRGVEPPPVPAAPERPEEPDEPGGQVIDRAVLAERRARRAEAAEQAQARVAAEALKAVEVLELRSAELERRLEEATAERDALSEGGAGRREALAAALESAAALRSRSREWQLRMRTTEVARAGDAVRLAVLEAERASGAGAARNELHAARGETASLQSELDAARSQLETAQGESASLRSDLESARGELDSARGEAASARSELETARGEATSLRSDLETARGEATSLQSDLEAARREAAEHAAELAAAGAAAAAARAELEANDGRFAEARAAWDRRREDLEAALTEVRGRLETARAEAEAHAGELERSAADARSDGEQLRERIGTLEAALAVAEGRIQTGEAALAAAETRLHVETVARTTLEDEVDRERAELDRLREELEAERDARRAAEHALAAARAEAERTGTTLQDRIAELERRAAAAPELERVAREHAAEREPAADAGRLVADLDAAADALRRRVGPAADVPVAGGAPPVEESEQEPPAPDAEPAVEWGGPADAPEREPCVPGVQPARPKADPDEPPPWMPPGFETSEPAEGGEPPAPDAEPAVESVPPEEPSDPEQQAPPADSSAALPPPPAPQPTAATSSPLAELSLVPAPPVVAPPPSVAPPADKPTGPIIVPASGPPPRALATGTERREYPLLRGAIAKLAHDDPAAAAALLVALLPGQGAVIEGPLGYDLTIREAGTFAVGIAGGRASVEQIDAPRPRSAAEFHLTADAVVLAELLAGVEHRIGRFFGPARVRGRKRRLKELKALPSSTATVAEAARAGAHLDPGLVYRLLSYAIHPTWTRGHDFTIAQEITGAPPETWYLTARDGAGVTVSSAAPAEPPDATVTMSRQVFDKLLREEPVPSGRRPVVRGDQSAVAAMHAWTQRAQGR